MELNFKRVSLNDPDIKDSSLDELKNLLSSPPPPVKPPEPQPKENENSNPGSGNPMNENSNSGNSNPDFETNFQFSARMQMKIADLIGAGILAWISTDFDNYEKFKAPEKDLKEISKMLAEIEEREGFVISPWASFATAALGLYAVQVPKAITMRKRAARGEKLDPTEDSQRMIARLEAIIESQKKQLDQLAGLKSKPSEFTKQKISSGRGSKPGVKRGSYNKNKTTNGTN